MFIAADESGTLGHVLRTCTYGSTGHVGSLDDLRALDKALTLNERLLREFPEIVVAANFSGEADALRGEHDQLWRSRFPEVVLLDSPVNRGHSIGSSDLDNMLFDYCRARGREMLCKSSHDILIDPVAFHIPVDSAQFYFINAVSYDAVAQYHFDLDRFCDDFFYPQTTFYVINVRSTDYLVDADFLDRTWDYVRRVPDYNGRIWEYIPGWACESLLKGAVERNSLTTCSLTTAEQWRDILELVVRDRITDCSFKGIRINGIMHAQPGHPFVATIGSETEAR